MEHFQTGVTEPGQVTVMQALPQMISSGDHNSSQVMYNKAFHIVPVNTKHYIYAN